MGIGTSAPGDKLQITGGNTLIKGGNLANGLTFVSASNTSGAAQKISFFGANRQDSGEEAVSIKGKMVSNMGGSGNTQKGELAISTTGVERMVIDEDGVTTFTGNVQVGGDANAGSANGTKILSNSGIQASNDNTSAPLWRGYTTNNSTPTSSIKTSGSATFGQAQTLRTTMVY